jgi:hypothetical protein
MTACRLRILLLAVLAVLPAAASAQIVARQGPDESVYKFKSPMILDVPMPDPSRLAVDTRTGVSAEIKRYTCDDVSLASLTMERNAGSRHGDGNLRLTFVGSIHVPDSFDRRVDVNLEIKKGDRLLGSAEAENVKAGEGKYTPFRTVLTLDEAALRGAYASEPRPVLEITVTVRDDR